ncbi:MAG: indolepyruvate ferredoxin oxidoreductase subunit alpha [Oscillospiraceae bacterium]|nr:indolepyruvate ferredoxin oxidoreductase subunit alpha [Oscillospiraceae bacterium]
MKHLLTGNEAIARGAYEAGVKFCSAYPGTPSTEIFESLPQYKDSLYCEWAPNEKVATEAAYGAAIAGVRSLTAMKHVGVNVAADPIFTAAYNGVNRGFVIVSADDPSMHSSQNEQDNRRYARFAKIALVEPSDSQECLDFMKTAYEISEQFDMPVLFRSTTRISHSKSLVEFGERQEVEPVIYHRDPPKFNCAPAYAYQHHPKVERNLKALEEWGNTCPLNRVEMKGTKVGVITASIAYLYAKDVFPEDTSFLKLGLTYPLPMDLIRDFASKVEKLYVVEELEPFMEEQIKAAGIPCVGKELVPLTYELNPQILREAIFGIKPETKDVGVKLASRPANLCPGCPHRGIFYVLGKQKNAVISGDIGCYTLGFLPPLNATDTCICMGAGFSAGAGMAKAFALTGQKKKMFGVVGDSTFFHSGMTGALEIIYNKADIIPVVLDNHITGMTGHQDNPGSGYTLLGEIANAVKIEDVLKAFGYENIYIVDPQDLAAVEAAVKGALESSVPAAIITRRPCLLIKRLKHEKGLCVVDSDKCIGCKKCLSVGCAAVSVKNGKSRIDASLCVGCTVCAQVCPVGAISRKEK